MGGLLAKKFKNVKSIWGAQPEEDYEEFEDYNETDEEYENEEVGADLSPFSRRARREYADNVVSINTTARLQVVIKRPTHFDEVSDIAEHLKAKNTVVLNLENAPKDTARRILDFLSGAAYISEGAIDRIAANTFIITPITVDLLGTDVIGELENNGLFF